MPHKINWLNEAVLVSMEGRITIQEVNDLNKFLHTDKRYNTLRYEIWFAGDADLSQIKGEEIIDLAADDVRVDSFNAQISLILVSNYPLSDAFAYNYKSIMEVLSQKWNVQIFRSLEDAFKYCGIESQPQDGK